MLFTAYLDSPLLSVNTWNRLDLPCSGWKYYYGTTARHQAYLYMPPRLVLLGRSIRRPGGGEVPGGGGGGLRTVG